MNQGRNTRAVLWEGRIWDSVMATVMTGAMPQVAATVSRSLLDNIFRRRVRMRHR